MCRLRSAFLLGVTCASIGLIAADWSRAAEPASKQQNNTRSKSVMDIKQEPYGKTADGQEVTSFTCANANGLVLQMINLGATVVRVETPDRTGKLANINTGFDTLKKWEDHTAFFGATVGRYANRIAGG